MGCPATNGGELTLRAWLGRRLAYPFVVLDDPERLADIACSRGLCVPIRAVQSAEEAASVYPEALPVLPVPLAVVARLGKPDPANAPSIVTSITEAVRLTQRGETASIVTNRITPTTLRDAGLRHAGHTEFLAELTGTGLALTMMTNGALRVVPLSIHLPLWQAIENLTTGAIVRAGRVIDTSLRRDFGLAAPRIAIAGLNPHAGEGGALRQEEIGTIRPAVQRLHEQGIDVSGPWAPDMLFTPEARGGYDVVLGLYHDQVLIPLKTLSSQGVSVTLGLPFIRTAPDQGAAFGIPDFGAADPTSLIAALDLAAHLATRRERVA
jgi:4-hydroxythreonine-4-phosphate dehydrogenase